MTPAASFPFATDPATREQLITGITALGCNVQGIAAVMQNLGDHRSHTAITQSLQRMIRGATHVSGEMTVIINLLLRMKGLPVLH